MLTVLKQLFVLYTFLALGFFLCKFQPRHLRFVLAPVRKL